MLTMDTLALLVTAKLKVAISIVFTIMATLILVKMFITRPEVVIAVMMGAVLFALFLIRKYLAIFLLVAYVPFHQVMVAYLPDSRVTGWKDFAIVIFFGFWVIDRLATETWQRNSLNRPIIAFILALGLSMVKTPNLLAGIAGLKYFLNFAPIYFIIAGTSFAKEKLKFLMTMLVILGAVNALYGLGIALYGPLSVFRISRRYYTGGTAIAQTVYSLHWFNSAIFAALITIGVCLAYGIRSIRYRLTIGLAMLVLFVALVLSLGRSAWICLLVAFVFLAILAKSKRMFLCPLIGLLILHNFLPGYIIDRGRSIFDSDDVARRSKEQYQIPEAIQLIASNPLGYGLGAVSSVNYQHLIGASASRIAGIESGCLKVGVEAGVLGLAVYLWMLLSAVIVGVRLYRSLTDNFLKWLVAGIVSFSFAVLIADLYVDYLKAVEALYWCLLGVLMSIEAANREEAGALQSVT